MASVIADQPYYILYVPRWYPSALDPQLGVFVRKQAVAVSDLNKVVVLYITGVDELSEKYESSGKNEAGLFEYIGYYRKARGSFRRILNLTRYLQLFGVQISCIIKDHGIPAIIHSHVLLRPALLSWYYCRKYKVPFVHSEHWTGFVHDAYQKKSIIYRYLCKTVIHKAAALISVSEGLINALHANGIKNENEYIIPNVIEAKAADHPREAGENMVHILTVADFVEKNKNICGTLRALAEIRNKDARIHFHLVGDGPDAGIIRSVISGVDPDSQWITLYGRKDNDFVLQLLQKADFLITNSNIETFSMITAEALAAGKPVIATRCGGPEYFVTPENGILIQPGNHQELTEAIDRMLTDYKKYNAKEISTTILGKFGRKAVGMALAGLYNNLHKS